MTPIYTWWSDGSAIYLDTGDGTGIPCLVLLRTSFQSLTVDAPNGFLVWGSRPTAATSYVPTVLDVTLYLELASTTIVPPSILGYLERFLL